MSGIKRRVPLPLQMLLGLLLGIIFGFALPGTAAKLMPIGTAFVQAVKMIVVPLVFTAITLGIYQMGNQSRELGKVSGISLGFFFVATTISLFIGLALNFLFRPGLGANLASGTNLSKNISTTLDWTKFFLDMIPSNIVAAMAGTNLLPVLLFATILGLALASVGSAAKPVVDVLESLMKAVFKMTNWIISLSPIAIFSIIAWLFATQGVKTIISLMKLVGVVYLGLFILLILLWIVLKVLGESPFKVTKAVIEPIILGFATRSSEATLPLHMEKLIAMGVPKASRFGCATARIRIQSRRLHHVLRRRRRLSRRRLPRPDEWANAAFRHYRDVAGKQGQRQRAVRRTRRNCDGVNGDRNTSRGTGHHCRCRRIPRYGPYGHECIQQYGNDQGGHETGRHSLRAGRE